MNFAMPNLLTVIDWYNFSLGEKGLTFIGQVPGWSFCLSSSFSRGSPLRRRRGAGCDNDNAEWRTENER
jgi:hypothetical protein